MERVFFFGGIASVLVGFSTILYQGIMFLKSGEWTPYPVLNFIDMESGAAAQLLAGNPAIVDALQKCPMSAVFIVFGLFLLWMAGRLRNRYS